MIQTIISLLNLLAYDIGAYPNKNCKTMFVLWQYMARKVIIAIKRS